MSSFENKPPTPTSEGTQASEVENKRERIVNSLDSFVIEFGVGKLYRALDALPEAKFPDTLVFLDTGARPLAYAIKPILEDICQRKHIPEPALRFMAVGGSFKKETMQARAKEIQQNSHAKRLLVIDDTIASGGAMSYVDQAFSALPKDERPDLSFFGFYTSTSSPTADMKKWEEQGHTFIPPTTREDLMNQRGRGIERRITGYDDSEYFEYVGLSHRNPGSGKKREAGLIKKASLSGVTKEAVEIHVQKSPHANLDLMQQLRAEMYQLGQKAVLEEKALDRAKADLLTPRQEMRIRKETYEPIIERSKEQGIVIVPSNHTTSIPEVLKMLKNTAELLGKPFDEKNPGALLEIFDTVVLEGTGYTLPPHPDRPYTTLNAEEADESVVIQQQEMAYLALLVDRSNVEKAEPLAYWDVSGRHQINHLLSIRKESGEQKHSPEAVKGYLVLYGLFKVLEMNLPITPDSIKIAIDIYLKDSSPSDHLPPLPIDLNSSSCVQITHKYLGRSLHELSELAQDPSERKKIVQQLRRLTDAAPLGDNKELIDETELHDTNHVSADMLQLRDAHAMEVFHRLKRSGKKKVIVFAGGAHVNTWRQSVKELYQEAA